jgi:O-antigen ligase
LKKDLIIAWWQKFELVAVIFLLLWGEMWNLPLFLFTAGNIVNYGLVAILVLSCWKQIVYWLTKDWLLISLVSLAVLSILWSAAPDVTLADSRSMLRTTFFGAYLGSRFSFKQQLKLVSIALAIAAFLTVPVVFAFPSYGLQMANGQLSWTGFYAGKQGLGRMMAIAIISFASFALIQQRRTRFWVWVGFFFLAAIIIWFSKSRIALVVALILVCIQPLYTILKQAPKTKALFTTISLLLASGISLFLLSNLEFIVVDLLGKNLEFNGRTPIWTLSIEAGMDRPLLGYGLSAFWPSDVGLHVISNLWAVHLDLEAFGNRYHSHNGFIDLFVQLGVVGLAIFLCHTSILILRLFRRLLLSRSQEAFWAVQIILFQLLFNIAEAMTMLSMAVMWMLYVAFSIRINIEDSRNYQHDGI